MKSKILILIILVLFLSQGGASEELSGHRFMHQKAEQFTAHVGQQDTHTVSFSVTEFVLPTLFYSTKSISNSSGDTYQMETSNLNSYDYSLSIEGADSQMFSAAITQITPSYSKATVTNEILVEVSYSPSTEGTHVATLKLLNRWGSKVGSLNLAGNTTVLYGDVNGDGAVDINDVTNLIYIILGTEYNGSPFEGDMNGDGIVDVNDVTELISIILGKPVNRVFSFLIVIKSDGSTEEFQINENTKVKIVKPNLVIENNGQAQTYLIEDLAQMRYEERMVTLNNKYNKLSGDHQTKENIVNLNTILP